MIDVISATRLSAADFWERSPLGLSLKRLAADSRLRQVIAFQNARGLPEIYNAQIGSGGKNDVLVFMHDDVWIDDYYFVDRIVQGLEVADVIGVAGNRRRIPYQPAWPFIDLDWTWDDRANLSGIVAHGRSPFGTVSNFGQVPANCELLDGVLLACRRSVLSAHRVNFDPRFRFHFYDMDFCRAARKARLRLSTCALCITHAGETPFGLPDWQDGYSKYIEKWED